MNICEHFYFNPNKNQKKHLTLKVSYFFQVRGGEKKKRGAYMLICEHFFLRSNKEIEKKSNF